jgi:hypothetical protein
MTGRNPRRTIWRRESANHIGKLAEPYACRESGEFAPDGVRSTGNDTEANADVHVLSTRAFILDAPDSEPDAKFSILTTAEAEAPCERCASIPWADIGDWRGQNPHQRAR